MQPLLQGNFMTIAILSSKGPSSYRVGASELDKAKKAMKELKKLKVNEDTYIDAEDSKSSWNWNWITGNDAEKAKIEKQTKLEKTISKNLAIVAAAHAQIPDAVSPEMIKTARGLHKQLHDRLVTDQHLAVAANMNGEGVTSFESDAYEAIENSNDLGKALKRNTIPVDKAQSMSATELTKAEKAMKELIKLKVDEYTYKGADSAESIMDWDWLTGNDAHKAKIDKQTKLEETISTTLANIAATHVHNPDAVSPETMKAARELQKQLHDRLLKDKKTATVSDLYFGTSFEEDVDKAIDISKNLDNSLNKTKPDAIPLDKTQSFLEQLTKLSGKIEDVKSDYDEAELKIDAGDMRKARNEMEELGKELKKMRDQRAAQAGVKKNEPGIANYKMQALPGNDALTTVYAKQEKALDNDDVISLIRDSQDNVAEVVMHR
jgi:hypothetical protein